MGPCSLQDLEVDELHAMRASGDHLAASCCGDGRNQQLLVHRCRFLEEAACASVCVNVCKMPTQAFFNEESEWRAARTRTRGTSARLRGASVRVRARPRLTLRCDLKLKSQKIGETPTRPPLRLGRVAVGVTMRMEPDYESLECRFKFGVPPTATDEADARNVACFAACPSAGSLRARCN